MGGQAAADGCVRPAWAPETKAKGMPAPMFAAGGGCSGKLTLPFRPPSPKVAPGGGGRSEAGVATGKGSWEAGSPRQV